jgi:hypothetical protein
VPLLADVSFVSQLAQNAAEDLSRGRRRTRGHTAGRNHYRARRINVACAFQLDLQVISAACVSKKFGKNQTSRYSMDNTFSAKACGLEPECFTFTVLVRIPLSFCSACSVIP